MDVLDKIFNKKKERIPKSIESLPEQKNEYSDLSNMRQMLAYTHRRQGLGFEENGDIPESKDNEKKGYVKPLQKKQIVDQKKNSRQEDQENKTEEPKIIEESRNPKLQLVQKKIHKIEMKKGKKTKIYSII